jgi:hypothetical protein
VAARLSAVSRRRLPAPAALALVVAAATRVSGCAAEAGPEPSVAPATVAPSYAVSAAVALTRAELVRVLGARNLVLDDADVPFRPPEAPRFTMAPRAVYQVILPDDPGEGFIVVYDFLDAGTAAGAAAEQATYLASGPGRIQSAEGTRHVLRQVGPTVVAYSWVPAGSQDARAPAIQEALETLGTAFDVPS